jgi:hypothetical protein
MANSFSLITKYLTALDTVYKMGSLTSILDNTALSQEAAQANQIKIAKMVLQGLGDYSRSTGYVSGDATLTWETHTFSQDRGRKFAVDSMDDMETASLGFGRLAGEFVRSYVVKELDAYRFATLYGKASNKVQADITTSATALTALDTAIAALDNAEVTAEGRKLFVSNTFYNLIKNATTISREMNMTNSESLNRDIMEFEGMQVVKVPTTRFYTAITQYNGSTAGQEDGGYIKNVSTGKDINFMIVQPDAIAYQGVKHAVNKIVTPEANQSSDAYLFFYRLYHDLFVYDNKVAGIYVHNKTT